MLHEKLLDYILDHLSSIALAVEIIINKHIEL